MKKNILLIGIVILIVLKFSMGREAEVELSVIKENYNDESKNNIICISFPQIQGVGDSIKEEQINSLIRTDAMKLVGGHSYPAILTTTVDIKEGKLLVLDDVVTDFDILCKMLQEDRFENITMWDGQKGDRKISMGYMRNEGLEKDLRNEEWDITGTNFGWYTDGRQLVIVLSEAVTYDEFAIDISEVEDMLDSRFLEKLEE